MNIEDLKKITDMAIANADRIVALSKEKHESSVLLQAHGALAFASSVVMNERIEFIINGTHKEVEEINEMEKLMYKKMNDIWERN